eukprot:SAG31_NODE_2058_length_6540_cov_2.428815_2_plen_261_part_00
MPRDYMPSCSATHCVRIDGHGELFSWATTKRGNRFGQLGQGATSHGNKAPGGSSKSARKVHLGRELRVLFEGVTGRIISAAAGGSTETGHSLAVTEGGDVFAWGCDRWCQLGLGAAATGTVGYTWEGGKIWQTSPKRVNALAGIRQVAAGTDHSVALHRNRRDVYTWGRGEHGQLGMPGKCFVGAPRRSPLLSCGKHQPGVLIGAVLAHENCSAALDDSGNVLASAGRCDRVVLDEMLRVYKDATTAAAVCPAESANRSD